MEARFVYVFVLGILFTGVKDLLRAQLTSSAGDGGRLKSRGLWEVYSGVVLLVALLFRAHNLPTLACCLLIQTVMAQFIWKKLHYDAAQTTIMHYWFGQAFFYFQVRNGDVRLFGCGLLINTKVLNCTLDARFYSRIFFILTILYLLCQFSQESYQRSQRCYLGQRVH